ncbi:MAG: hypothetical protein WCX12_02145 [Candidatus Paceibacterota bacterium]
MKDLTLNLKIAVGWAFLILASTLTIALFPGFKFSEALAIAVKWGTIIGMPILAWQLLNFPLDFLMGKIWKTSKIMLPEERWQFYSAGSLHAAPGAYLRFAVLFFAEIFLCLFLVVGFDLF